MCYSVIIPTYHRAKDLERAIQSVLRQTLPAAEIIVVEDGQAVLCEETLRKLSPVIRLVQPNEKIGAARARNVGLDQVWSKFVAFLDDDDEWLPEKMRKQIDWLEHTAAVAVFCGYEVVHAARRAACQPRADLARRYLYYENLFGSFSSLAFRRDERTAGLRIDDELPSCQDWDFTVKLSGFGQIDVVPEILMSFHSHAGPRITANMQRRLEGLMRFCTIHAADIPVDAGRWLHARIDLLRACAQERPWRAWKYLARGVSRGLSSNYHAQHKWMHLAGMSANAILGFGATEGVKVRVRRFLPA